MKLKSGGDNRRARVCVVCRILFACAYMIDAAASSLPWLSYYKHSPSLLRHGHAPGLRGCRLHQEGDPELESVLRGSLRLHLQGP